MPKRKKITPTLNPFLTLDESQSVKLLTSPYIDCEWCFQFDNDEPQVFASTTSDYEEGKEEKLSFTLTNQTNTYIIFKDNKTGREFKLFAREKI